MSDTLRARAEAFLALADKATPAPWIDDNGYRVLTEHDFLWEIKHAPHYPLTPSPADNEFVCAARNDAPGLVTDLLAEVERLRGVIQRAAEVDVGGYTEGFDAVSEILTILAEANNHD